MKAVVAVVFLVSQMAWGQAAPMRVYASNGVKAALEALQPAVEKAAGRQLAIEYGSSAALKRKIEIVPLSELPLVKGVQAAGPLPGDLQNYLRFQASVAASAKDPAAAKKAIQFLTSPAAAPVFKAKGMETK